MVIEKAFWLPKEELFIVQYIYVQKQLFWLFHVFMHVFDLLNIEHLLKKKEKKFQCIWKLSAILKLNEDRTQMEDW